MTRQGGANTMKWPLLLLSVTALILSPGLSLAQSKATTEPNGAKAQGTGGNFMKDSWLTTKTKSKLVANGRVKARHITVETQNGVVTLLGKVGSAEERAIAEEIAKGVGGAGDRRVTMRYHFSGVAGTGMNPRACLMRARGHDVQGSHRSLDMGKNQEIAARLRRVGIQLTPHDGTAISSAIDRFVYSTAVEADTPEMRAARALGLPCVSRPRLLAEVVDAGGPGVAVAGTSGKSTIVGMVAWLVREANVPATVLGGAALVGEGTGGCFVVGPAEGPVVAEACESDGTLAGYRPAIGLVHNVSRDHGELDAIRPQF